jgi:hypothetical protein
MVSAMLLTTATIIARLCPGLTPSRRRKAMRTRPFGIGRNSSARDLFDAFAAVPVSAEVTQTTLREILNRLERTHGFSLSDDDKRGIADVDWSLYVGGSNVRVDFGGGSWIPSYAELMTQTDLHG